MSSEENKNQGRGESATGSSGCYDSARKEIEKQRERKLDEQGDYANGYADGCEFAIDVLQDHTYENTNQRSVDRVLDQISRMERQIDTVEMLTDQRLAKMYKQWKDTLNEAWEMINNQAR